jgi:hypothetical protein
MVTVTPSFDDDVRPSIGGYPDVEGYLSTTICREKPAEEAIWDAVEK